ncbi:MAG TPA: UDP-glucose/GDP-mannose dehydrogenase family protein [Saprospiraceae bacterium]|nr:UDP-glucose/GDP-mannose dehydrogenase family protein [Saprospiraceae bacterium]MCC6687484.1 UDP-glucose/GDP-mannose dehydrogenase family protein [Saprospiraceae bacterium]HMV24392.1 UDP-glucose/GDP-mannose dehydrogenase family protein [Saprospiraceae bacterium]HMW74586.1 UDP-glucose/GDP-mannose dehydrogenase family protein [Saprospiraceae bacterium]HMX81764.1 UDP-glucose/GDP-mannose dehydrogenase family protein [Saprospiraceae bacterium]
MNIAVVGTGYVGLVTGTCFAETGNQVICVDNNLNKLESLKEGNIPIFEPGLDVLFNRNVEEGRLKFTSDLKSAVEQSSVIFLALPTPPDEDGSADLSYILGVANDLSTMIDTYKIIVDKSTVPVGTAELVHAAIAKNTSPDLFDVVSNPEFLREGLAVEDFMKPDRVVIGTSSDKARKYMDQLYRPFVRQGNPIFYMDERSAEITKYAANAYLATRISFMNEIANLCERVGANVDMVRMGMGSDSRIGKRFLFPGVGYGGSCFPKDVLALYHTAEQYKYDFRILKSVMAVNEKQKFVLFEKISTYFNHNLKGLKIAVWGLAFKPNTDDIREAPALYVIDALLNAGAHISVFDPEAMDNVKKIYGDKLSYTDNAYAAAKDANALAIITEWSEFRNPDFERLASLMADKIIFDGRNVYELEQMAETGFHYESIGREII